MIRDRFRQAWVGVGKAVTSVGERAGSAVARLEERRGLEKGHTAHRIRELALLSPRLVALVLSLLGDSRVPLRTKITSGVILAYIVSPIDIIPELILGPFGLIDDIAAIILALHLLINSAEPSVVREHWKGDEDILEIVKDAIALVESFVPDGLLKSLKKWNKGNTGFAS